MNDAGKEKRQAVRANAEQLKILQAALIPDRNFTAKECERLSSETGLTCTWIKSWVTRFKNKGTRKRAAKSEPEDPPPLKRGRVVLPQPENESSLLSPAPAAEILPPRDDSYFPTNRNLTPSGSDQNNVQQVLVPYAGPGIRVYHSSFSNYQPPANNQEQKSSASHPQQSTHPQSHPSGVMLTRQFENPSREHTHSIPPSVQPVAYTSASGQNNPPPVLVSHAAPGPHVYPSGFYDYQPIVNNQQRKSSASRPQQSTYQQSHPSSAMLLPRQSENIDPALQPNAWGTPQASANWIAYNHAVPPSASNSPASDAQAPAFSFVPTPVARPRASLFAGNELPPPHATANRLGEPLSNKNTPICDTPNPSQHPPSHATVNRLGETFSNKNTPLRGATSLRLQSPFVPNEPTQTPSRVRSDNPKHNIENDDSQRTTAAFSTPIDDNLLFSSVTPYVLNFLFRSLTRLFRCSISLLNLPRSTLNRSLHLRATTACLTRR
ncbi:hypothetical protein B0H12DRAFT_1140027 [Mycena haematopus]|nr:hypothetical protein B0H12DRAFT_1140027 [Mycena haematopus]